VLGRSFHLACLGLALSFAACGGVQQARDARRAEIVSAIVRADEPLIRSRPRLVAGKYARMAASPYDFYRATVPLALHDFRENNFDLGASAFSLDAPLVPGIGDPHPENFGLLLGEDGALALEPNDFDGADFVPYLWDVRRLTAGVALAARVSNDDDPVAREAAAGASRGIALAAARGYADGIAALAKGGARERIVDGGGDPMLDDLFQRGAENLAARTELDDLTVTGKGIRRLRRGVLDPDVDVPSAARAELPDAIARYRETLQDPPEPAFFTLLDAVRELGSGVASWPRVRIILLVRGPSDDPADDVLLEMKELGDSGLAGLYPPGVFYNDVGERVRLASRGAWARPDAEPLWGTTTWEGFSCQIKLESEAQKGLRVRRMRGDRGTPEALESLARRLGGVLARAHAATPKGGEPVIDAIDRVIARDPGAFAAEQADVGDRYAAEVLLDAELFAEALTTLGPRLGLPLDPADTPSPALRAIYAEDAIP